MRKGKRWFYVGIGAFILVLFITLFANSNKIINLILNNDEVDYKISLGTRLNDETFNFVDQATTFKNKTGIKVLISFPLMEDTHHGNMIIQRMDTGEIVMQQHIHIVKGMSGQLVNLDAGTWDNGNYKCIFKIDDQEMASVIFDLN